VKQTHRTLDQWKMLIFRRLDRRTVLEPIANIGEIFRLAHLGLAVESGERVQVDLVPENK